MAVQNIIENATSDAPGATLPVAKKLTATQSMQRLIAKLAEEQADQASAVELLSRELAEAKRTIATQAAQLDVLIKNACAMNDHMERMATDMAELSPTTPTQRVQAARTATQQVAQQVKTAVTDAWETVATVTDQAHVQEAIKKAGAGARARCKGGIFEIGFKRSGDGTSAVA